MRRPIIAALALAACRTQGGATEVSREECAEIVRKQDRLRSETPGSYASTRRTERTRIDECTRSATASALRCVRAAGSVEQLASCDALFR